MAFGGADATRMLEPITWSKAWPGQLQPGVPTCGVSVIFFGMLDVRWGSMVSVCFCYLSECYVRC